MLLFTAKLSVTSSVPATLVSPVVLDTVNMLDPTFTSASMSALPVVNVIMSVSAAIPILFVSKRTLSTKTYPLVLNIFKPPLLAVCVKATSVFDNKTSSVTSSVPEMSTAPLVSVIISGSPFMPICSPVNRTPSTSTNPLELEIVKLPLVPECVRAASVFVSRRLPASVVVSATCNSPAIEVSPEAAATVNFVPSTLKSLLTSSCPVTCTDSCVRVMMSMSALMPILLAVKRTLSTSTYPALLEITSPPLAAVCVRAAFVLDIERSSLSEAIPVTFSIPAIAVSPEVASTVNIPDEMSKFPAMSRESDNVVAPVTPRVVERDAEPEASRTKNSDPALR